uniref:Uncharacterized protein n=1 Tax=viral metagenome TaxID=1070528 RepID=A0A6C0I090_9ZZZZ
MSLPQFPELWLIIQWIQENAYDYASDDENTKYQQNQIKTDADIRGPQPPIRN